MFDLVPPKQIFLRKQRLNSENFQITKPKFKKFPIYPIYSMKKGKKNQKRNKKKMRKTLRHGWINS